MDISCSVEALLQSAGEGPIWEAVLESSARSAGESREACYERMSQRLRAMEEAEAGYQPGQLSLSGLSGGDGARLEAYAAAGQALTGGFGAEVMAAAVKMAECNACMHRIVAAPTAGACGPIPAVLLPYRRRFGCGRDELVKALFTAAGFGAVIARRASISGAEAGCQAEVGSAAAMAAAALVQLRGGSKEQMAQALALALKSMLGLVCDPVAGLVELPCVKRNAAGAMMALTAADMALAGIVSKIPPDEVIDAMAAVGAALPPSLRETGQGGLAATPTGKRLAKEFYTKVKADQI